ncbi:uncharacterized protein TrAtP1_010592 [Trichoderma atroviride]|uniref:uncharacterized protein n=1 Tax=Hypocrea atroviridis TaxID=63577 RepID=UPI00331C3ED8|nr:hypothetical protein TrAtP1_010592 [Trichoderma atroviride]
MKETERQHATYIIWYTVAKHAVGILVLLWMWFVLIGLFAANFPKLAPATIVAQVAAIVMTSNELQVRQIGSEEVIAQGEAVYPPFIIFPYRLAIVLLGVLIAYFRTIFPYPILEASQLRGDVAKAICKLANYNACMQQLTLGRLYGHVVEDQRNDQRNDRRQQTAATANADRT